jgi:hypothetical protein
LSVHPQRPQIILPVANRGGKFELHLGQTSSSDIFPNPPLLIIRLEHNVRAHRTQISLATQPNILVRSGAARLLGCGADLDWRITAIV